MKLLPTEHATGSWLSTLQPEMERDVPISSVAWRVFSSTCATAAIEARASPRNPMVCKEKRSSAWRIFDVAWRSKASRASVSDIPFPSSITCIDVFPASTTSTSMRFAPASTAFSTSSLITEAGRWITSPAAIWFATESGRSCIISLIYTKNLTLTLTKRHHSSDSCFISFPSIRCKGAAWREMFFSCVPFFFPLHSYISSLLRGRI